MSDYVIKVVNTAYTVHLRDDRASEVTRHGISVGIPNNIVDGLARMVRSLQTALGAAEIALNGSLRDGGDVAEADRIKHARAIIRAALSFYSPDEGLEATNLAEQDICARGDRCVCFDPSPVRCNAFRDAAASPKQPWDITP